MKNAFVWPYKSLLFEWSPFLLSKIPSMVAWILTSLERVEVQGECLRSGGRYAKMSGIH